MCKTSGQKEKSKESWICLKTSFKRMVILFGRDGSREEPRTSLSCDWSRRFSHTSQQRQNLSLPAFCSVQGENMGPAETWPGCAGAAQNLLGDYFHPLHWLLLLWPSNGFTLNKQKKKKKGERGSEDSWRMFQPFELWWGTLLGS